MLYIPTKTPNTPYIVKHLLPAIIDEKRELCMHTVLLVSETVIIQCELDELYRYMHAFKCDTEKELTETTVIGV